MTRKIKLESNITHSLLVSSVFITSVRKDHASLVHQTNFFSFRVSNTRCVQYMLISPSTVSSPITISLLKSVTSWVRSTSVELTCNQELPSLPPPSRRTSLLWRATPLKLSLSRVSVSVNPVIFTQDKIFINFL